MTEAELLTALANAAASEEGGEGLTVNEIRKKTGWSANKARGVLRNGVEEGAIRVSRKKVRDLSGRVQSIPSYVFIQQKEADSR